MGRTQIGDIIDDLGVTADLDDDALVGGAYIILKVTNQNDGETYLVTGWSPGLTFFERSGMLRIAERTDSPVTNQDDEP